MPFVVPIVEGHGEVEALPALLHRLSSALKLNSPLVVNPPIRVKVGSFLNDDEYFCKHVTLATAKALDKSGSVLILLDCEDDCPAILGPRLLERARNVRVDARFLVVLAYREFETWFIAAARSLKGQRGLPNDLEPPPDPDAIRDAKGWLSKRMDGGYDPLTHQLPLTRVFDLSEARSNGSFSRFCSRIVDLLGP